MRLISTLLILLATLSLLAQVRMIPHLTRANGGFTTSIIIENTSVSPAEYTFQPYSEEGDMLTVVEARSSVTFEATELFADAPGAASFSIDGDNIQVSAAYTSVSADGSPAHVGETDEQATAFRLFAGDWSTVFDGIAVVNMGVETEAVWVTQRDQAGNIVASHRIADALAAKGKALFVIGSPNGGEFEHQDGHTYEV